MIYRQCVAGRALKLTASVKSLTNFTCDKVKVKVKVSLEQAVKAQRGSRGIALLFL